jgi:hypothetical protein
MASTALEIDGLGLVRDGVLGADDPVRGQDDRVHVGLGGAVARRDIEHQIVALADDFGPVIVLPTLPAMALTIALVMLMGKRKWVPQLPARKPAGGCRINQALVLWVLIALVAAMILFFVTWYRRMD